MTKNLKYILPWTFLVLLSCQNQDNVPYELIKDIKTDFKINFLSDSAYPFKFQDNSAKQEFIQNCKEFISEKDLIKMLDKHVKPFNWDKSKLRDIVLISSDSLLKINLTSNKQNYLYCISAPIIDDKGENAIVRMYLQLPDEQIAYGGECVHLFRRSKDKWTEITRENCINY
jgi:hypothetical protein